MAFTIRDQGLAVQGFSELQRALAVMGGRGEFGLDYELKRRLTTIARKVAATAPRFVTHTTGRHGDPNEPRLEDSVRTRVGRASVSVYSSAVYGGAQNYGAGPKAGWAARGPHIRRDRASRWMSKGLEAELPAVRAETEGLVDWLVREFDAA